MFRVIVVLVFIQYNKHHSSGNNSDTVIPGNQLCTRKQKILSEVMQLTFWKKTKDMDDKLRARYSSLWLDTNSSTIHKRTTM